jgi:hypothetical protein
MAKLVIALSLALLAGGTLAAGNAAPQAVAPGMLGTPQDYQAMMKAMETAQAEANRPGDEKLGCEELESQFTELMNDPALKARIEAAGAAAQGDMSTVAAAQGAVAASTAASAAASMTPGGQWAALAAAVGQAQAAQAAAAARSGQQAELAKAALEMLPQLLRGERLINLASVKKCEWAAGIDLNAAQDPSR